MFLKEGEEGREGVCRSMLP